MPSETLFSKGGACGRGAGNGGHTARHILNTVLSESYAAMTYPAR